MKFGETLKVLENPDRIRIFKDEKEICTGYIGTQFMHGAGLGGELFEMYKDEEVKKIRCAIEIRHRRWEELGLKSPLTPNETPDFKFSDLQMKLYYMIYL